MTIHESIKGSIAEAMRAKDAVRLRTLRSLSAAMTNEVVAKKRKPDELLTDEEALAVLKRAANQRKDSIEQFTKGGRPELAEPEAEELAVIEAYLPAQLSREQVEEAVKAKIAELGADKSKAGMVMGAVMKDLKGQADGNVVKEVVDSLLA
ncbi:MAG TPA: GatB/YqeY domain-containing protein [Candidatus Paceibacterota bacterium]|nr:GatB/YqeY domain-containing protein [Candidatus Paceibacterota bacterium]